MTRETFQFRVDKKKLQEAEWRDRHYLLRSNLTAGDPGEIEAVSQKGTLHTSDPPSTGTSRPRIAVRLE